MHTTVYFVIKIVYHKTKVGYPTELYRKSIMIKKDYIAHLDGKKRITLRGAEYQYYNVKEYGNGCILLEPREVRLPDSISVKTLNAMDAAIRNYKNGISAPPVDLSDFTEEAETF